jgi:hypothetical protein
MTIYDADFVATEELQQQYQPGVTDSAAGDQEAISEQPQDQVADSGNVVEEQADEGLSDKEMNFRAMREEIAKMKAEKEALEQNFDTWKRELASNNVQRQPEPPRKRAIDELPDDDIITGAQLKKMLAEKDAEYTRVLQEQELLNQETRVKAQYSDYDEVATKYGIPLLKQEPDLSQAFVASQNKAAFLYKLGKMHQLSQSPPAAESSVQRQEPNKAQRILDNSRKPGTLSGAVSGQSGISKADYFASMPDKEFQTLMMKNLEEI